MMRATSLSHVRLSFDSTHEALPYSVADDVASTSTICQAAPDVACHVRRCCLTRKRGLLFSAQRGGLSGEHRHSYDPSM